MKTNIKDDVLFYLQGYYITFKLVENFCIIVIRISVEEMKNTSMDFHVKVNFVLSVVECTRLNGLKSKLIIC